MLPEPLQVGTIVQYTLTAQDEGTIHARRRIYSRCGNPVEAGQVLPMVVCRIWADEFGPGTVGLNGQVILDGDDSLWVTSAPEGDRPGTWRRKMQG